MNHPCLRLIADIDHALPVFIGVQKLVRLVCPRRPTPQADTTCRAIGTTVTGDNITCRQLEIDTAVTKTGHLQLGLAALEKKPRQIRLQRASERSTGQ